MSKRKNLPGKVRTESDNYGSQVLRAKLLEVLLLTKEVSTTHISEDYFYKRHDKIREYLFIAEEEEIHRLSCNALSESIDVPIKDTVITPSDFIKWAEKRKCRIRDVLKHLDDYIAEAPQRREYFRKAAERPDPMRGYI